MPKYQIGAVALQVHARCPGCAGTGQSRIAFPFVADDELSRLDDIEVRVQCLLGGRRPFDEWLGNAVAKSEMLLAVAFQIGLEDQRKTCLGTFHDLRRTLHEATLGVDEIFEPGLTGRVQQQHAVDLGVPGSAAPNPMFRVVAVDIPELARASRYGQFGRRRGRGRHAIEELGGERGSFDTQLAQSAGRQRHIRRSVRRLDTQRRGNLQPCGELAEPTLGPLRLSGAEPPEDVGRFRQLRIAAQDQPLHIVPFDRFHHSAPITVSEGRRPGRRTLAA